MDKETIQRRFIEAKWMRGAYGGDLSRQSGKGDCGEVIYRGEIDKGDNVEAIKRPAGLKTMD